MPLRRPLAQVLPPSPREVRWVSTWQRLTTNGLDATELATHDPSLDADAAVMTPVAVLPRLSWTTG